VGYPTAQGRIIEDPPTGLAPAQALATDKRAG